MKQNVKSIRPFIGSENFEVSRSFYRDLGFEEIIIDPKMSLFRWNDTGFYLQDGYVKDWIDNTMVFMEVEDTDTFYAEISALNLREKYKSAKVSPVQTLPWGKECFVHDPSGVLWHFGEFFQE
ncbi:glyoxalase [Chryseobacterium hagamense]|uniref:Glyoxalase n=1 Tax=Chryseobacterium hagamense TaxID=395935 RepID=A0A511YGZ8_9FLAO|nr:glyoxalase [Chryseobacterium hagamense]GEN74436.1 glyoxalase [Chryseobacterium hagamense]